MKWFTLVVPVALAAILLAGCGGGGGSSNPSPFAGHWEGTWGDGANAQSGIMSLTIGTDGKMSGSIHNDTYAVDGTASGSVNPSGHMAATYVYPGSTYTASGTVALNPSSHLVGTLQTYFGGVLFGSVDLDLSK